MADPAIRTLRLAAPLRYREAELPFAGFPFKGSPAEEGVEEVALYDFDALVRSDPQDGPRAVDALPAPRLLARNVPKGTSAPALESEIILEPGSYAFLQSRASTESELLGMLEGFARQVWWERIACQGPWIVRRVYEDGRWAAQVWRALAPASL